jgi:hypothetical protein
MADLVTYTHNGPVSTIAMDDGKVNVFSIPMLRGLHEAFDQAERHHTAVLLKGRPGCFTAGFDLKTLGGTHQDVVALLRLGATLAERILSFPAPVVVGCTGHAFPAGAFLLMAADTHWDRWSVQTGSQRGADRPHAAVVRDRARPPSTQPGPFRSRRRDRRHVRPVDGPGSRPARQGGAGGGARRPGTQRRRGPGVARPARSRRHQAQGAATRPRRAACRH